jgi:class 3 adenylate cyclase
VRVVVPRPELAAAELRARTTAGSTSSKGRQRIVRLSSAAVRCAQAIVDAVEPLGIAVRVGVHTGEVELIDAKVGGIAVAIGARVAARAAPGEVLVSQTVKDLTVGSGLGYTDAGEHELKGVPDAWRLYRLLTDG